MEHCVDCSIELIYPVHRINDGLWLAKTRCINCYQKATTDRSGECWAEITPNGEMAVYLDQSFRSEDREFIRIRWQEIPAEDASHE